jgi:hypothetical protein
MASNDEHLAIHLTACILGYHQFHLRLETNASVSLIGSGTAIRRTYSGVLSRRASIIVDVRGAMHMLPVQLTVQIDNQSIARLLGQNKSRTKKGLYRAIQCPT